MSAFFLQQCSLVAPHLSLNFSPLKNLRAWKIVSIPENPKLYPLNWSLPSLLFLSLSSFILFINTLIWYIFFIVGRISFVYEFFVPQCYILIKDYALESIYFCSLPTKPFLWALKMSLHISARVYWVRITGEIAMSSAYVKRI